MKSGETQRRISVRYGLYAVREMDGILGYDFMGLSP